MARVALVTGGTRGIGRATAMLCAARGWNLALNFRHDEESAAIASQAVRDAGARAILLRGDVANETDVISMFREAESQLGTLDGVVINAGIVGAASQLADMDSARLRRMFDTNVYGAYLCARVATSRCHRHWRKCSKESGEGR